MAALPRRSQHQAADWLFPQQRSRRNPHDTSETEALSFRLELLTQQLTIRLYLSSLAVRGRGCRLKTSPVERRAWAPIIPPQLHIKTKDLFLVLFFCEF